MATSLLDRLPGTARGGAPPLPARLLLAGVVAGARAAGLGLLGLAALVLLAWATAPHSRLGATDALRGALQAWLLAHRVALALPTGPLSLAPLGLVALPLAAVAGSARQAAARAGRAPAAGTAVLVAGLALSYVTAAVLGAALAGSAAGAGPGPALRGALAVALVAGAGGALVPARRHRGRAGHRPHPSELRAVLGAGAGAVLVLLGSGAALAGASLALHAEEAARMSRELAPGLPGSLLLQLLTAAAVPNAVVWAAAVGAGPGFAVGTGTSVSPFGVELGPLPSFPLLAALPDPGPVPLAMRAALLAPLAAGLVAGTLLVRRLPRHATQPSRRRVPRAGLLGLGAGAVAGLLIGLLCALAGGSLGRGHLAAVGPVPWRVGLAVTLEVGAIAASTAALGAAAAAPLRGRPARRGRSRQPQPQP